MENCIKWIKMDSPPKHNKDVLLWRGTSSHRQDSMIRAFYEGNKWYYENGNPITEEVLAVCHRWLDIKPPEDLD